MPELTLTIPEAKELAQELSLFLANPKWCPNYRSEHFLIHRSDKGIIIRHIPVFRFFENGSDLICFYHRVGEY